MSDHIEAPEHFICPLTMEIMVHPLKHLKTGKNFERFAINNWMYIEAKNTCPLTREPIAPSDFVENKLLAYQIRQWKEQNEVRDDDESDDDDEDDDEDDELFLETLRSAQKIKGMTTASCPIPSDGTQSYQQLLDLGAKVLRQRDEKLTKVMAARTRTSNKATAPIPQIADIFEIYQ